MYNIFIIAARSAPGVAAHYPHTNKHFPWHAMELISVLQCAAGEPARLAYNFPQLGLATNAALLRRLRGLADIAALKSFLKSWAAEELPALLAGLGPGGSGQAAVAAAGEFGLPVRVPAGTYFWLSQAEV